MKPSSTIEASRSTVEETRPQPPTTVDPAELSGLSFRELDGVFRSLEPPATEPAGLLRGRIVSVAGVERLPVSLRRPLTRALGLLAAPFWRGKLLEGAQGSNTWLLPGGRLRFGAFEASPVTSDDGMPAIGLDYDTARNPGLLRPVLGELRALSPGLYLGRMNYRARSGPVRVQYFTLEA